MIRFARLLLGCAALALACGATAQDKPPLKILVGFAPGGSADVLARLLAGALQNDFSTVIVENRVGAGGRIALTQVKNARPDGQTVIVLPSGPMVMFPHVYRKLDYDAAGAGTVPHFLGVLLEQSTGMRLNHIPFQGGAPANNALLGGHIGYKFDVVSETAELHRSGKVRVIAVTGATRDPQVPEVPTLREQGIDMEATAWFAMYGPAGLKPEVLARLEQAVMRAVQQPAVRDKLLALGYEPIGSNSQQLAAAQRADLARWEKPIKAAGVTLE